MISVIKATGEKEPFSEDKLLQSVIRAGVPVEVQHQVVSKIKNSLYPNISTAEIYRQITDFLGKSQNPYIRSKYSLKQAIMDLGPTGFPFEDFIAKILESYGYSTQVRVTLQGKCISHETDVVAKKGTEKAVIEAKFHNQPGIKTDVHVALYTKARFNDILERNDVNKVWLITNTKISQDAVAYAMCMGMKVTSWNFPEGESLRELIEKSGLAPITALSSLSQTQRQNLLNQHAVLCMDICKQPSLLNSLNMTEKEKNNLLSEASFLCSIQSSRPKDDSASLMRSYLSAK